MMKLFVLMATPLFLMVSATFAEAQLDQTTIRFVGDVLLGTEYGDPEERVCIRWKNPPSVSTFSDGSHHPAVVNFVLNQINSCFSEEMQVKALEPNDENASIKIYFCPHARFAEICKNHGVAFLGDNEGYFAVRWNNNHEIESAIVLIAHNKLRGNKLQHFLLEELTQSLGLGGDSTRFEDSVFYEDASISKYGTATRLSKLDKKLIRFLYEHVEPGISAIELGVVLGRKW